MIVDSNALWTCLTSTFPPRGTSCKAAGFCQLHVDIPNLVGPCPNSSCLFPPPHHHLILQLVPYQQMIVLPFLSLRHKHPPWFFLWGPLLSTSIYEKVLLAQHSSCVQNLTLWCLLRLACPLSWPPPPHILMFPPCAMSPFYDKAFYITKSKGPVSSRVKKHTNIKTWRGMLMH